MSSSFGVTWGWHKQFSHRVLHQHASFCGESRVHSFQDHGLANGHALISEAWCKLRFLLRWPVLSDAPFPLSAPFAQTFSSCREKYDALVAREFQEAAPKCNVIVIDGNQKVTRRCCAERFTNVVSLPGAHLRFFFLKDCSHAPKRKPAFCSEHQMPFQRDAGVHVKKKACLAHDPYELLTCSPSTACASWPLQGWLRNQVHIHSKKGIEKPRSDMDCLGPHLRLRVLQHGKDAQAQLPLH